MGGAKLGFFRSRLRVQAWYLVQEATGEAWVYLTWLRNTEVLDLLL